MRDRSRMARKTRIGAGPSHEHVSWQRSEEYDTRLIGHQSKRASFEGLEETILVIMLYNFNIQITSTDASTMTDCSKGHLRCIRA